jgi:hypothetical protein
MSAAADTARVGAQWRGLARAFRMAVKTDDVTIDRVLPGITAPLACPAAPASEIAC